MATDWHIDQILEEPSAIEAGLVRSLWRRPEELTPAVLSRWRKESEQHHRWIEHAVDFLQFLHRFRARQLELSEVEPPGSAPLSNVLHISSLGVGPAPLTELGASSSDVRLGRHFIVFRRNQIASLNSLDADNESRQLQEAVEVGWGDHFVLHPGEMVLAVTLESLNLDSDCSAQVLSRSSLGRMGLLSATAVQVQPGFSGCLTLELVNLASVPLRLTPGQRVAQVVPAAAVGRASDYVGKYQNQDWKPKFSAVISDWEMPILRDLDDTRGNIT